MEQPAGEQQALSGRRGVGTAGSGIVSFGHAVLEIGRQHARQTATRVVNLQFASLTLGRADLTHIDIVNAGPEVSWMGVGGIGAAVSLDVGPHLDDFLIRLRSTMAAPFGESRDLLCHFVVQA